MRSTQQTNWSRLVLAITLSVMANALLLIALADVWSTTLGVLHHGGSVSGKADRETRLAIRQGR